MNAPERFTRARKVTATKNYGTHELVYVIPLGSELEITELFVSTTQAVIVELQYSDDGGTTWSNPWDEESTHLLWLIIGAGIPGSGKPTTTWFLGDGTNTKLRIKITNTNVDNDATVFYLIKGLEREV